MDGSLLAEKGDLSEAAAAQQQRQQQRQHPPFERSSSVPLGGQNNEGGGVDDDEEEEDSGVAPRPASEAGTNSGATTAGGASGDSSSAADTPRLHGSQNSVSSSTDGRTQLQRVVSMLEREFRVLRVSQYLALEKRDAQHKYCVVSAKTAKKWAYIHTKFQLDYPKQVQYYKNFVLFEDDLIFLNPGSRIHFHGRHLIRRGGEADDPIETEQGRRATGKNIVSQLHMWEN